MSTMMQIECLEPGSKFLLSFSSPLCEEVYGIVTITSDGSGSTCVLIDQLYNINRGKGQGATFFEAVAAALEDLTDLNDKDIEDEVA